MGSTGQETGLCPLWSPGNVSYKCLKCVFSTCMSPPSHVFWQLRDPKLTQTPKLWNRSQAQHHHISFHRNFSSTLPCISAALKSSFLALETLQMYLISVDVNCIYYYIELEHEIFTNSKVFTSSGKQTKPTSPK